MLKTKDEIHTWLDKHNISSGYRINDDLSVDVLTYVNLNHKGLTHFPVQFGMVNGDFMCESNLLTSLKGGPQDIRGHFECCNNQIEKITVGDLPIHLGGRFLFFQEQKLEELMTLYNSANWVDCSLEILKKTVLSYERLQHLSTKLVIKKQTSSVIKI